MALLTKRCVWLSAGFFLAAILASLAVILGNYTERYPARRPGDDGRICAHTLPQKACARQMKTEAIC